MATIIGTELDDPNLTGTTGADTISGLGGRDHLYGGAGNDTLFGGAGDDAMHGDAGADIMFGGAGNDDYFVDDVNDVVSETTVPGVDDGGTNDRVYSTVSYTLSPFLERLVLLESAVAISATGNAQVNAIVGNSNANIISGGGGKDTLTGGLGADTFVLGPANAANTVTITDFAAEDKFGITASDYGLSQGSGQEFVLAEETSAGPKGGTTALQRLRETLSRGQKVTSVTGRALRCPTRPYIGR